LRASSLCLQCCGFAVTCLQTTLLLVQGQHETTLKLIRKRRYTLTHHPVCALSLVRGDSTSLRQHRSPLLKSIVSTVCLAVVCSRLLLVLVLCAILVVVALNLDLGILLLLVQLLLLALLHCLMLLLLILVLHLLRGVWWKLESLWRLGFRILLARQSKSATLEASCSTRTKLLLNELLRTNCTSTLGTIDL